MPIRPPTERLATSASAPALRARSGTLPQPGQPVANAEAALVRPRVTISRAGQDDVGDVRMHDGPPVGESWLVSGGNHRTPSRQSLVAWWVCHLAVIPPIAVPLSRFFLGFHPSTGTDRWSNRWAGDRATALHDSSRLKPGAKWPAHALRPSLSMADPCPTWHTVTMEREQQLDGQPARRSGGRSTWSESGPMAAGGSFPRFGMAGER